MGQHLVRITERAQREIQAALDWWVANRRASPRLLAHELSRARGFLHHFAEIAQATTREDRRERRMVLRRTGYVLFYRVSGDGSILVHRLVHSARQRR